MDSILIVKDMPVIRITQKLQKETGLKTTDLMTAGKMCAPFEEWYAHVFVLDRKKQIIFVEPHTLFTFCLENILRKDARERLPELFGKGLAKALFMEGASAELISKLMDVCRGELKFAKTENRRTVGAMNEFVKHQKYALWDQSRSVPEQDRSNRHMPSRGFPGGSKDYKFPIEVFAEVITKQFGLDFIPQKEKFIKNAFSQSVFEE